MHFLIKGIPVRHLFSIRKFHHQDRQPGFAEKHLLQAAFLRLDIAFLRHGSMPFPEAVPVDEKIAVRRSLPFFHKILKLWGLCGSMV